MQAAARARRARSDARGLAVREVLELFATSTDRLIGAAAGLRRAWAGAFATQGLTRRQIGDRLGVSHQRVSALLAPAGGLSRGGPAAGPPPAAAARSGV